jgi:HEAT repeat protein
VIEALFDPDPGVRRAGVRALLAWGGPAGLRAIAEISTTDPAKEVRLEAVAALGTLLAERVGA